MLAELDFNTTKGYNFVAEASVAQWQSSGFVKSSLRDCPRLLRRPASHDDCGRLWLAVSVKADVKASNGLSSGSLFADMNTLPPNDIHRLRVFQKRVDDLRKSGLLRAGKISVSLHLFQTPEDKPLDGFDEDYLRSFLQTLRQFTLERESVNFNLICDLINENCGRSEIQDWVTYAKELWKDTLASAPLAIQSNGVDYNVETALELFWYGGQVHSDLDKDRQIEELAPDIQDALKMLLFMSFHRLRHALTLVNSLIVLWLDKPDDPVTPFNKSADSSQEEWGGPHH